MASYVPVTNTLNFAVALKPTSAFPLDPRTMFGSYSAAAAAAATAVNAGSSESIYYIGQRLTVFENDVVTHFTIEPDKTLKPDGSVVATDDKTIVLNGEKLSLKDFGVQYYAYHEADNILPEGEYTFPGTMPADPAEGDYVKVSEVWYKYTSGSWAAAGEEPHETSYYELTSGWKAGLEPKVVGTTDNYTLGWFEPSTTTIEGIQSIVSTLQTTVDAMESRVDTVENAIDTLNGNAQTSGSVAQQVAAAVAQIVSDAPEAYDTLKEISDWITNHADDASAMNSAILQNTSDITALETLIGSLPEEATADDIVAYIQEAVAAEQTRATGVESGLDARIEALEGHDAYTLPTMSTTEKGGAKVDGTTLTVADETLSVNAIGMEKVTGLSQALTDAENNAVETANNYTDTNAIAKTSIVTTATAADSVETASDAKVISEKMLLEALTWKTTM